MAGRNRNGRDGGGEPPYDPDDWGDASWEIPESVSTSRARSRERDDAQVRRTSKQDREPASSGRSEAGRRQEASSRRTGGPAARTSTAKEADREAPKRERPSSKQRQVSAGVARRRRLLLGAGVVLGLIILISLLTGGGEKKTSVSKASRIGGDTLNVASISALDSLRGYSAINKFAKKGLPIFCGGAKKKFVALTLDDGPGELSQRWLTLFAQRKVPVTLFRIGKNVPGNEEVVKLQRNIGWDSGSHTQNHPALAGMSETDQRTEIVNGANASTRALGRPTQLFRPPYESRDANTAKILKELGLLEILWNVDTQDAIGATSSQTIAQRAIAGLRPGSIILLHEVKETSLNAMPTILDAIKKRGLTPVTISRMLAEDPPTDEQLRKGFEGCLVDLTPGKAAA